MTDEVMSKINQELLAENVLLKERIRDLEKSGSKSSERGEEALRIQEMQFRTILESTGDGILAVDNAGKVIRTNKNFVNLWNVPSELLETGEDEALLKYVLGQLADPASFLEKVQALYESTREDFDTILFRDGRIVERHSCPLLSKGVISGRVWSFRDVTERRRAEEALRYSEHMQSSILQAAPIGIGLVSNRIIKRVNHRLCEMTGYAREDLINKSARLLYPTDEDFEFVGKEKYEQISHWGTGSVETHWIRKDGRILNVLLSSTPLDPDNLEEGVTFTALDITERKQVEEELIKHRDNLEMLVRERTAELENERSNLEETNTALKVLLQKRDEDKKDLEMTFLTSIRKLIFPYLERLRCHNLTEAQESYVNLIESNLRQVASPFLQNLASRFADFTSREIQIAEMIREGKSSKEIASLFNISSRSVDFHRDNIRKKLQLTKRKVNLRTYLLSLSEE